jgi:hypothetical protein
MNRNTFRSVACTTLVAFAFAIAAPVVQAGTITTEQAFAGVALDAARDRLATTLARADVQAQLTARGVDPALVAARVASLTDEEVRALDQRIDQLPAGGDVVGTIVFIFIILLITDLLGWTHVFPFTNKGSVN